MDQEQELYDAATSGNTDLFIEILGRYRNHRILEVCKFGYFGCSILHVAASNGHINVVNIILQRNPDLSSALDSRNWSSLHLSSVKGRIDISNVLLTQNPYVARVKTSEGDTILHLCLKHQQLESLRVLMNRIKEIEFANLTDAEGNNIMHLAVILKYPEALTYMFERNRVKVNAMNAIGNTPLDIALQLEERTDIRDNMIEILKQNGARSSKNVNQDKWLSEKRNVLIVLASLTATMTFQAGVNPPGGTWQDSSVEHKAGESIMAYYYPGVYTHFLASNTTALMGSLITVLLLLMGLPSGKGIVIKLSVTIMWIAILSVIFTYTVSITMTTPKRHRTALFKSITVGGITLGCGMGLFKMWHVLVNLKEFIYRKLERLGII
ncbi:ankyrin repeat-containing protein ITN1-like [Impatiens glandulifera]|uniref:ankyrin repeat-containing protein ITN1-like n=1 Tax=Impatiens glandulifera TaxID=253017 RepID=UPI001FB124B8|nr:ankyrin repeat-containing protein ITN1-like [Impatiens glandulifera]